MFGVDQRIRAAASAGVAGLACGVLAVIGAVWLSIAVVGLLSRAASTEAAQIFVGFALLAPLAVFVLRSKVSRPAPPPMPAASDAEVALMQLARTAERMAEKAPLTSVGLALAAGVLTARSPTAFALCVQVLTKGLEHWAAQRSEPPRATNPD